MTRIVMKDWLEPSRQPWPDEDGPWVVTLYWAVTDGSVECVRVDLQPSDAMSPRRIDSAVLRQVPLGRLIRSAKAARYEETGGSLVAAYDAAEAGKTSDPDLLCEARAIIPAARAEARPWQARRAPGRPRYLEDGHFRKVARVYSRAALRGDPPRLAVVQACCTTSATASRWIARARELGFLPRTEPGVAKGSLDFDAPEQKETQ